MSIELRLTHLLKQEIAQGGGTPPASFERSTVLAETGLDSLGFATLIVTMEKEFGLDPFGAADEIIYPETFADLLEVYEAASRAKAGA
jgi:acyl carrier protein